MKKRIFIALTILTITLSLKVNGQYCEINGTFDKPTTYKYAYIVDIKQKEMAYSAIVNNHFLLKVLQPKVYQNVYLFFEQDSTKTYSYFLDQTKRIGNKGAGIVIENANLLFEGDAKHIKVLKGELNEELHQMRIALNTNNYDDFFDQHPDSQLTISILKALLKLNQMPELEPKYDCKKLYDKLSDRIKNTPEGIEIRTKI